MESEGIILLKVPEPWRGKLESRTVTPIHLPLTEHRRVQMGEDLAQDLKYLSPTPELTDI